MTSKFKTHCSCGQALLILGSKKGAYCTRCDRAPVDNPLSELGKDLIDMAYAMNRVIAETHETLDPKDVFEPFVSWLKKECQGGCGRSFPESQMHSGIWCSECYEMKKETN